jgi:hypothetical protein
MPGESGSGEQALRRLLECPDESVGNVYGVSWRYPE